jgi:aldehyde:ferredoxin oxidoreductase
LHKIKESMSAARSSVSIAEIARAAIETEDRAALMDSLILCKFVRGVFQDFYAETASMLRAVTGWDVSAVELRGVAVRVVEARKALNQREGWTRAEDTLPARMFDQAPAQPTSRPVLTRERLESLIAAYYAQRGWSADGRVIPLCEEAQGGHIF